ncbi:MAG: hypothetical protein R3E39_17225 [Anaerolineae bacterium]
MAEEVGFTTMAGKAASGEAPTLGIGMLGYAFMGKAHTNALKKLPYTDVSTSGYSALGGDLWP